MRVDAGFSTVEQEKSRNNQERCSERRRRCNRTTSIRHFGPEPIAETEMALGKARLSETLPRVAPPVARAGGQSCVTEGVR